MVVHGDRQDLLGPVLADDVLVEDRVDLLRLRQLVAAGLAGVFEFFTNDVVTQFDAFVADENRGARNQLAYFVLALAAKRTIEEFSVFALTAVLIAHAGLASVTRKSVSYDWDCI